MKRLIRLLAANRDIKIQENGAILGRWILVGRGRGGGSGGGGGERSIPSRGALEQKPHFAPLVETLSFNAARATNFRNSRASLRRKMSAPAIRRVVKGMAFSY